MVLNMTNDAPLNDLLEFLRFPSVSTDSSYSGDVKNCAKWLRQKLENIGLFAVLHETAGHPIIVAKNAHRAGRPTVLIYGHYDVQPPDPLELWESKPFEPTIKNDYIFARGSADNKGQIMSHIQGVAATLKENNGELPVNLTFLIEGEEEVGSESLETFLTKNHDELACDIIVISDTGMVAAGRPTLSYGLRGITALEIKITGPSVDLHSGLFGGSVANPATALAKLLATLHDENGVVLVDGFYADVRPITDEERAAWKNLPFDDSELKKLTGSPVPFGELGFTSFERDGRKAHRGNQRHGVWI